MIGFDELFGDQQVMVILRGLSPADTVAKANLAWDAGVEVLEVPIGGTGQLPALIAAVRAGAERGKVVGAGTVITREHVAAAATAGARYTVAPGFDPDVLVASLEAGLPHLPGVATPGEVQRAYAAGCRWMKVFPANVLGPEWFRAVLGPFPDVKLVATGGISVREAEGYYRAGAHVIAFGSALTDPAQRNGFLRLAAELRTGTTTAAP